VSAPLSLRPRLVLGLAVAACAAAAFWISDGVTPWGADRTGMWHHYEYLAEGFLGGHTYLPVAPAPELLRLKDPYDPAANAPYRLWDASLYNGRYYLYFGPTPVLVMIPWSLVSGHPLPQNMAAASFAALAVAGLALLLWEVRGRHFPGLSDAALALVLVTAFHASWLPVTLRRSGVWDLPIVAATACTWWALYFLWKFQDTGGRTRWAAAAGAALALLMGSRATFVPGAAAVALLLLAPAGRQGEARRRRWAAALTGAAIAAAGGLALLAYNRARFGSWTEFGLRYVLVPFNAWTYLLSLPRLGAYFPFLHPFWTDSTPAGFVGFEEVYGILFMMPVHLAGLAAVAWALRGGGRRAGALTLAAGLLLTVSAASVLFCWAWACSRYTNELLAGWTAATAVGLMALFSSQGARRLVRVLAAAACVWSVACVWLASAEFRGFMAMTNPRTYCALAHALDYPSLWVARLQGRTFGPAELTIRIPSSRDTGPCVLLASGRAQRANRLVLVRTAAGRMVLELLENEHRVLATPPLEAAGGRLRVTLSAPWLYPPPAHPYWDPLDSSRRKDLQTLFSISWGPDSVQARSIRSADPVDLGPAVRGRSAQEPDLPYVESMQTVPAPP